MKQWNHKQTGHNEQINNAPIEVDYLQFHDYFELFEVFLLFMLEAGFESNLTFIRSFIPFPTPFHSKVSLTNEQLCLNNSLGYLSMKWGNDLYPFEHVMCVDNYFFQRDSGLKAWKNLGNLT